MYFELKVVKNKLFSKMAKVDNLSKIRARQVQVEEMYFSET